MIDSAADLPIGAEVPGWTERPRPPRTPLDGRTCRLEPLDPVRHAADLYAAFCEDADGVLWTYLPYGPFASEEAYVDWAKTAALAESDVYFAIIDRESGRAVGVSGYLRVDPANGSIEVGNIAYAPALQRSVAGTEAQYLLMRRAFDELGYRRYEWKCNALNAPSKRAAERYGFSYEGTFRQASVAKGRNRDTAWFSILDSEWPAVRAGFEAWLDPVNFKEGIQIGRLSQLIEANR
ncbi:GNAT family N-acetyltransferase [Amorphus orientalis]|uniref:RimJ/RimL family protein N-acetyltransferase n=1 Tax=Amorphus orientalis TaxID=649198 RepID=A0AAE3VPX7_9HYPH|nr:GNAT family protein [Amorphus orientalis]MDQ0316127.1 RimJ/RimL family protein N-acetyltransferase [Amorphus orientalis]